MMSQKKSLGVMLSAYPFPTPPAGMGEAGACGKARVNSLKLLQPFSEYKHLWCGFRPE